MADYKAVNIPKNIILVEKHISEAKIKAEETKNNNTYTWIRDRLKKIPQAYVVAEGNKKVLESARNWASCWYADPIEHTYENGSFKLKLQDAADDSSNSGKLSFWNCVLTAPDGKEFLVGINAELLLDTLLENTFINGTCQNKVYLGRTASQVGVYTENMQSYKQSKLDDVMRANMNKKTDKYVVGDIVSTLTKKQVYLGTIYKIFDIKDVYWESYYQTGYYRATSKEHYAVKFLAEPRLFHVFIDIDDLNEKGYSCYPEWTDKMPKRVVTGHIADIKQPIYYVREHLSDYLNMDIKNCDWDGRFYHKLDSYSYVQDLSETDEVYNKVKALVDRQAEAPEFKHCVMPLYTVER